MSTVQVNPGYSVIIPVYNSAATLQQLAGEIEHVFVSAGKDCEIIFVDDSSSDNSWQVLKEIKQQYDNIKIIRLNRNCGQNTATICGIHHSIGNQIITIDDDLQYPSKEILKLIEFCDENNYQIVYGQPTRRMHGILHSIIATLASLVFDYILLPRYRRIKFYTTFRIMAREHFFNEDNTVIPSKHLFYFWEIDPEMMGSLLVEHEARKNQSSNYSLLKLVRHYQPQLLYAAKRTIEFLLLIAIIAGLSYLAIVVLAAANAPISIEQSLILVSVFLFLLLMRYLCSRRLLALREIKYTIAEKLG